MKRWMIRAGLGLLLLTLIRLLCLRSLALLPDEAYYWTWSQHLALSYYDHPPMTAYLIRFFEPLGSFWNHLSGLPGDFPSEWPVRAASLLLSSLATLVMMGLSWKFKPRTSSISLVFFLSQFVLIFAIGGLIMTPDTPMMFFWVCSLYALWQATHASPKWWGVLGFTMGLGFLSKYTMAFFLLGAAFYLLAFGKGRKWLATKGPYLSLGICLVIFLPVLWWNQSNQWISFLYQWRHGTEADPNAGWKTFANFLGGQAGVITPFVFLALIFCLIQNLRTYLKKPEDKNSFILSFSLPLLAFFSFTSFRGRVEANWPVCAYPVLLIALADSWGTLWSKGNAFRGKRTWAYLVLGSAMVLTILVHWLVLAPPEWLSPENPVLKRHYGWRELGQETGRLIQQDPSFVLAAESYQIGSELLFYSRTKQLLFLGGLPAVHPIFDWQPKTSWVGKDALLVIEGEPPFWVTSRFAKIQKSLDLTIFKGNKKVRVFSFFRCYNFKG